MSKKITYIEVFIPKNSAEKSTFKKEVLAVLAENERYIVFDDDCFTKISKRGDILVSDILNKHFVGLRDWGLDLPTYNGIIYSIYTNEKIEYSTIKNRIQKFIEIEYGGYFKVDLEFIK